MIITRVKSIAVILAALATMASPLVATAYAQGKPRRAPAPPPSRSVSVNGYAMIGRINLTATESFDAITGKSNGPIFGGGARVSLPWVSTTWGGLFVDAGAWRYQTEGQRVFVSNGAVYPLNIPVEIAMTPIELSVGWQFRIRRVPKFTPYVSAGVTAMQYEETSDFADTSDNVSETYSGFHVTGGAEFRIVKWVGVAGEVAWSRLPDAIGQGGVAEAFNENDLGGTSFRFKVTVGR